MFGDIGDPKALDAAARRKLAHSLQHIADRAADHLRMPPGRLCAALNKVRDGRQNPGIFARYYDLVTAVTSGEVEVANGLLDEIVGLAEASPVSFDIVPYWQERLGSDFERFPRLLFGEFSDRNPMAPPIGEQAESGRANLREALGIVERVDPKIREEIDALIVTLYMASGNPDPEARGFGGVTSLYVWGGSFVNIDVYDSSLAAANCLVHEVTHGVLFGLSFDEPLVWNDPDESYESPLRLDPRPMDGIYHATLVCGRMAFFESARLELDNGGSRAGLENLLQRFHIGTTVIEKHGDLSNLGRRLLDTCKEGLARVQ